MKRTFKTQTHWTVSYYSSTYNSVKASTFDKLEDALEYFNEKREAKRKKLKLIKMINTIDYTEFTPRDVDVPALVI